MSKDSIILDLSRLQREDLAKEMIASDKAMRGLIIEDEIYNFASFGLMIIIFLRHDYIELATLTAKYAFYNPESYYIDFFEYLEKLEIEGADPQDQLDLDELLQDMEEYRNNMQKGGENE